MAAVSKKQEQKIRDDERKHIGKLLIGAAKKKDCDPAVAIVFRDLGKVLMKPFDELVIEGVIVILDEIIDREVAAGRGERITIRGKPGYRSFAAARAARPVRRAPSKRRAA